MPGFYDTFHSYDDAVSGLSTCLPAVLMHPSVYDSVPRVKRNQWLGLADTSFAAAEFIRYMDAMEQDQLYQGVAVALVSLRMGSLLAEARRQEATRSAQSQSQPVAGVSGSFEGGSASGPSSIAEGSWLAPSPGEGPSPVQERGIGVAVGPPKPAAKSGLWTGFKAKFVDALSDNLASSLDFHKQNFEQHQARTAQRRGSSRPSHPPTPPSIAPPTPSTSSAVRPFDVGTHQPQPLSGAGGSSLQLQISEPDVCRYVNLEGNPAALFSFSVRECPTGYRDPRMASLVRLGFGAPSRQLLCAVNPGDMDSSEAMMMVPSLSTSTFKRQLVGRDNAPWQLIADKRGIFIQAHVGMVMMSFVHRPSDAGAQAPKSAVRVRSPRQLWIRDVRSEGGDGVESTELLDRCFTALVEARVQQTASTDPSDWFP